MICLEKMLKFDDFTSLSFFLCQEREFVYYLQDMQFLNCVQHVPKSLRSMLQPCTKDKVHKKSHSQDYIK